MFRKWEFDKGRMIALKVWSAIAPVWYSTRMYVTCIIGLHRNEPFREVVVLEHSGGLFSLSPKIFPKEKFIFFHEKSALKKVLIFSQKSP